MSPRLATRSWTRPGVARWSAFARRVPRSVATADTIREGQSADFASVRETLDVFDTGPLPPLPWDDVVAAVPDGGRVVGSVPGVPEDAGLPEGFSRAATPGDGAVVLVAPTSEAQVDEALRSSGTAP